MLCKFISRRNWSVHGHPSSCWWVATENNAILAARLLKTEIFEDKRSVLAHLKIVRGSVIVTYLAPHSEGDSLIQLALVKLLFMIQVGVCELNIVKQNVS